MAVSYLLALPSSNSASAFLLERSFLITAAGQSRIHTGFPFQHPIRAYRSALERVTQSLHKEARRLRRAPCS